MVHRRDSVKSMSVICTPALSAAMFTPLRHIKDLTDRADVMWLIILRYPGKNNDQISIFSTTLLCLRMALMSSVDGKVV